MYILDSDVVRLFLRHKNQQPQLVSRITGTAATQLWISIITVEEGIAGAERFQRSDVIKYSAILATVVSDLGRFQILPWCERSFYKAMPERAKQHHRNDWKIGAIALAHGFTIITRNTAHFSQIQPVVKIEDWTK